MSEQITIQAPNAPATGKQWGLIRHLAHEAGMKTATEAVVDVLGSYTKGEFTRELASNVITELKARNEAPDNTEEPANQSRLQAFRDGWTRAFTPTPQIDPLPGMGPMGWAEPATTPVEPELDLEPKSEPAKAMRCGHWGMLEKVEVEPDPEYPDEIEHEIVCRHCGTTWVQVEEKTPVTVN